MIFILSIVTVWMVIAVKIWMDTNTLIVFGALEIVGVCAGKTAISRVLTGVSALMRVPVVTGGVVSNNVIKPSTIVSIQIDFNFIDSGTDCLIIFVDKLPLSAGLVHDEHLIRVILTSCNKLPSVS